MQTRSHKYAHSSWACCSPVVSNSHVSLMLSAEISYYINIIIHFLTVWQTHTGWSCSSIRKALHRQSGSVESWISLDSRPSYYRHFVYSRIQCYFHMYVSVDVVFGVPPPGIKDSPQGAPLFSPKQRYQVLGGPQTLTKGVCNSMAQGCPLAQLPHRKKCETRFESWLSHPYTI